MDHPLTRTLDQVLMEFTIVWKLIAYTPSRNVRENLALFYSHNILLLCHKSKVFPSISCPYFPRWHPLAMVTCMCQPSISWSPLRSVCPIGLSVLCHIGFSLHYFRVISNWLRVCFLLPLDVAWACSRIDGTPKQRRARISSRKLENNQTGKRLWHLLLLTFLPKANTGLNLYWLEKGLTCLTPFQSNFRVKGRYEISLEQKNYKQRDDFPEAGRWRKEAEQK